MTESTGPPAGGIDAPRRRRRRGRRGGGGRAEAGSGAPPERAPDARARASEARDRAPGDARRGRDEPAQRRRGHGGAPAEGFASEAPRASRLERTLEGSHIDASKPADDPLTEAETAEMRQHLRFLFKNREPLRLKVNASEDLLLNGARAPTHRGQVIHLLGKVDLACVTSALTRLPDARARAAMLAGVVRFSSDVGILLLYLESLHDVASRQDAAAAFGLAINRIHFAGISAARMRRVLDLVAATFEGHQRVQVLFGLLQSETFRAAFDASQEALPAALADLFVPIRAVHETILEGRPNVHGIRALESGVRALLDAPVEVLRAYPEAARERLLESAIRLLADPDLEDQATDALLLTLPRDSRAFSRIGMLRAAELMRRHDDEAARSLLVQIRDAHPGFQMPAKWISALDAPRIARIALWTGDGASEPSGALRSGFWLDQQRSVWVRIGRSEDAERMTRDALMQRQHAVAGIAPVLECGVSPEDHAYVVLPVLGRPLAPVLTLRGLSRERAFGLALAGVQILHSLALAGVELPDVQPARFLAADGTPPSLWLADLSHARRSEPVAAGRAHRHLAAIWCESIQAAIAARDLPLVLDDAPPSLPDLIRSLAARA